MKLKKFTCNEINILHLKKNTYFNINFSAFIDSSIKSMFRTILHFNIKKTF